MDTLATSPDREAEKDRELEAVGPDREQGGSERVGTLTAEAEPSAPQGGLLGKLHEQGFFKNAIALNQQDKKRAEDRAFTRSKIDDAQKDVDTWEQELRYKNELLNNPVPGGRTPDFYKSDIEYAGKKLEAARAKYNSAKAERDAQASPYGTAFARGFLGTAETVARGAEGELGIESVISGELRQESTDIPAKPVSGFWPNLAQGAAEFGGSTLAFFAGGPEAALPLFALSGEGQFRDAAEAEKITADPATMDRAARLYGWTTGALQAVVPSVVLRGLSGPAREAVAGTVARIALRMASGTIKTTAAFELANELSNLAEKYGLSDLSGKPIDWNEIIQSMPERAKQSAIGGLFFGLAHEGGKLVKGGYRLPGEEAPKPAEALPPEEAAKDQELAAVQPSREEQLHDELGVLATDRSEAAEARKAEIQAELASAAPEGAVSPPEAVEAGRATELPAQAETLAEDRAFLEQLTGRMPDAEREALEKTVDQNLPAFHADMQDFYDEAGLNFDLTDAQVRDVARLMAQGKDASEALNDYADKAYKREKQRQEAPAAGPLERPQAVGEGIAQPGEAVAGVGKESIRPAAERGAQQPGQPVRGASPEEAPTPAHRARFRDLLKGNVPRKQWGKLLGTSLKQTEALIKEAEDEGLLRVRPNGTIARTALARAEPAGEASIVPSRLEPPKLEVPPDLIFNRAVAERQSKTGEVIDPSVIAYAKGLSEAEGTPDYDSLLQSFVDEGWANKANVLDLAHLLGVKVTTKTTKSEAVEALRGKAVAQPTNLMFAIRGESEIGSTAYRARRELENIRLAEDKLRREKKSNDEIAKELNKRFKTDVTGEELANNDVWWRIEEKLAGETGRMYGRFVQKPEAKKSIAFLKSPDARDLTHEQAAKAIEEKFGEKVSPRSVRFWRQENGIHSRKTITSFFKTDEAKLLSADEMVKVLKQRFNTQMSPEEVASRRAELGLDKEKPGRNWTAWPQAAKDFLASEEGRAMTRKDMAAELKKRFGLDVTIKAVESRRRALDLLSARTDFTEPGTAYATRLGRQRQAQEVANFPEFDPQAWLASEEAQRAEQGRFETSDPDAHPAGEGTASGEPGAGGTGRGNQERSRYRGRVGQPGRFDVPGLKSGAVFRGRGVNGLGENWYFAYSDEAPAFPSSKPTPETQLATVKGTHNWAAKAHLIERGPGRWEMEGIATRKGKQRRGIGAAMWNAIELDLGQTIPAPPSLTRNLHRFFQKYQPSEIEDYQRLSNGMYYSPDKLAELKRTVDVIAREVADTPLGKSIRTKALKASAEMDEALSRVKTKGIMAAIREGTIQPQVHERELDERGLFSPSLEAAKAIPQETGTVQQMKAMLLKAGAKPKELDAVGFDKQFPDPQAKISRQEIEQFLRENRVGLGRVQRPNALGAEIADELERAAAKAGKSARDGILYDAGRFRSGQYVPGAALGLNGVTERLSPALVAKIKAEAQANPDAIHRASSFESYSTPGGTQGSYREVVVTLPTAEELPIAKGETADELARSRQAVAKARATGNIYTSSHWPGITNPLLHYRIKDFLSREPSAPAGVEKVTQPKVRVLDELQSDWAQRARDSGTRDPARIEELRRQIAEQTDKRDSMASLVHRTAEEIAPGSTDTADGLVVLRRAALANSDSPQGKRATEVLNQLRDIENSRMDLMGKLAAAERGTPSAPFISSTSDWVDLGLKQALQDAAKDPSVTRFAWAPGSVQAERYGIKEHVGALRYDSASHQLDYLTPEQSARIRGLDPAGTKWTSVGKYKPEELPSVIGRDMSEELLSGDTSGTRLYLHDIADLEIGGHGMRSFYGDWQQAKGQADRTVRGNNKIGRLEYNPGIVGTRLLKLVKSLDPEAAKIEAHTIASEGRTTKHYRYDEGDLQPTGESTQHPGQVYPSIPITPKLREALLKGQPMFAGPTAVDAAKMLVNSLKGGKAVSIARDVIDHVHGEAKQAAEALPKGTNFGVFVHAEPDTGNNARMLFEKPDGSTFGILADRAVIAKGGAFFDPASGSVGLLVTALPRGELMAKFGQVVRGRVYHELVHVLRESGRFAPEVWARLLSQAKALRILDGDYKTYLESIGDEAYKNAAPGVSGRDLYEQFYAGDEDFQERMDQEAVAHVVELYHASQSRAKGDPLKLRDEEVAPINDILDAILDGTYSKQPARGRRGVPFTELFPKEADRNTLLEMLKEADLFSPEERRAASEWLADQKDDRRGKAGEKAAKGCLSKPSGFSIRD